MTYASIEDWLDEVETYYARSEAMTFNEIEYARTAWQLATERCEDIVREWADVKPDWLPYVNLSDTEIKALKAVLTAILTQIQSKR